jgi:hypothetical protein
MGRNSIAGAVGKSMLGVGFGFALYYLVTGLGFGAGGRGEGEGLGEPTSPTEPPSVPPPPPARPKDETRLNFVLSATGLEQRDANWRPPAMKKIFTLDEMIARIKDGGRSDVTLKISGDVREGTLRETLSRLKQVGIDVYKLEATPTAPPSSRVSGNARGEYTARRCWGRG